MNMNNNEIDIKTVPSWEFVLRMNENWIERLNNHTNPALKKTWKQIVKTFNYHINNHHIPDRAKEWTILSPPTGSGKTQSLILYASMLSVHSNPEHPAILIITRRIVDADSIRDQINDLGKNKFGGRETAIAYHSKTKASKYNTGGLKLSELKNHPVVVITHKAYQQALQNLGHEGFKSETWSYFLRYNRAGKLPESLEGQRDTADNHVFSSNQTSSRRLVVIDECLDIINSYEVTLPKLQWLKNMLTKEVQNKFAYELEAIDQVLDTLQTLDDNRRLLKKIDPKQIIGERMLIRESVRKNLPDGAVQPPDFSGLISELKGINPDQIIGVVCPNLNAPVRLQLEQTLRSMEQLYKNWVYYSNGGKTGTGFYSSEMIVPMGLKGCVVMDATADTSILYDVHRESQRLAPESGSRDYSNVKLHVSVNHKVGKTHLTNEYRARGYAEQLMGDLNVRVKGRETLLICHMGIEDHVNSFPATFKRHTAHWGELDGSNEFRHCDSVVIFGLNFKPKNWATNVFFACQGIPKDDGWFSDKRKRVFRQYEDIRRDLEDAQLAVDTIQGINRVQCRQTIDGKGNCKPTDVYLLLPMEKQAKTILNYIRKAMPNMVVEHDFDYNAVKRKVKQSDHENGLCSFLKISQSGEYSKKYICRRREMSPATFERLISKANEDATSMLAKTMAKEGISYHVKGHGRGSKAFFLKQ